MAFVREKEGFFLLSNFKKYPKWVRLSKPFRIFAAEIEVECFGKYSSVLTTHNFR